MMERDSKIKVSIIIPVYNGERYLKKCLDSVINQTFRELEILCINDGSTDGTLDILKEYEKADSRVHVIDKENTGYGNSVNIGIDMARGNYIGIVESDDFIAEDMYEKLFKLSKDGTVDIVKGNFWNYYYDVDKKGVLPKAFVDTERNNVECREEPFTLSQNPEILWGHPSIWSAIYRKEFLRKSGISFVEGVDRGWEDNPFFHETLCKAESILWTKEPVYYYWKNNPDSSSNALGNPLIPFIRMQQNLDVLKNNRFTSGAINKRAYARALMYVRGALEKDETTADTDLIYEAAYKLLASLDENVFLKYFCTDDQAIYYKYMSPLLRIGRSVKTAKVLIYNWLPFDNPWNYGGGVTVYCRNLISEILEEEPDVDIYFLSSGFAYVASMDKTYIRKIDNVFGERVHQYEIVNSPVPAEQRWLYVNPLVALENQDLKELIGDFIENHGPFQTIHFNNIEGLSLDVLDLKQSFPETKFIYSIHNYVPMCVNGSYYMRHKHCNCNPDHTGEDCFKCTRADIRSNIAVEQYKRGLYGIDPKECISQNRWIRKFGFERLDEDVSPDDILEFAQTATRKLNENCDHILAVSKRVYDIAEESGFDKQKLSVSYIGTKVAERQIGRAAAKSEDGMRIVFLGNDINYEEKGYPFLLDALAELDDKYASKIELVLTVKQAEHAEIYYMLNNFRDVRVIQGYTHDDLEWIFEGCHLSIVPVLWEDNLPQIAIESVAYGVPVLASSAGGASELCEDEMFRYECGNAEDLRDKIIHFLDKPEDLERYWTAHHGLFTMKRHWDELMKFYGISSGKESITISVEEWNGLLKENEFLRRHVSGNREYLAKDATIGELWERLEKAWKEAEMLRREMMLMKRIVGKVMFRTDDNLVQGDVGAGLFKLTLPEFNYSDIYVEIRFVRLVNVSVSYSDILRISGTWQETESGSYTLLLHQAEWVNGGTGLAEWIYFYIKENSINFFGRYPGKASGYHYEIITLTSRAERDAIKYEALNEGFVDENEIKPEKALNAQ